MDQLQLDTRLRIGIQTIHRRTEPATAPWLPNIDELVELVELVDRSGYDSLWVGDHISFAVPVLDPLLQLAQAAMVSRRLTLGTSVYLLPLRHPAPVAKQVATLDHLTEGRLIFGVGVGGEFAKEYEVCGVPIGERGARLSEGIGLLHQFWSGEPVSHAGRFYGPFSDVPMRPPARQHGGPPIWCGGRSDGALRRTGRLADGWLGSAMSPAESGAARERIEKAAAEVGRLIDPEHFGLSVPYAAREPDQRSIELLRSRRPDANLADMLPVGPGQLRALLNSYIDAGLSKFVVRSVGTDQDRDTALQELADVLLPMQT